MSLNPSHLFSEEPLSRDNAADNFPLESEARAYFGDESRLRGVIDQLYAAGALYVGAAKILEEPAALKVTLPLERSLRAETLRLVNRELAQAGYPVEDDMGQEAVMIWLKEKEEKEEAP